MESEVKRLWNALWSLLSEFPFRASDISPQYEFYQERRRKLLEAGYVPMLSVPFNQNMALKSHRDYEVIEILREGEDCGRIVFSNQLHPAMNAVGLWWRPAISTIIDASEGVTH